jgi:hypothetical protein
MRNTLLILPLISVVASGCSSSGQTGDAGTGDASRGPVRWSQLRPLIETHCVSCHHDEGIAQISFQSPEMVAAMAPALADAVASRSMPPIGADASGACNTLVNTPHLTATEIDTFQRFAASGAVRDDNVRARFTPPPAFVAEVTTRMSEPYTPRAGASDDYRCFIMPITMPAGERFITAFNVKPGERRVVHHVLAFDPADMEAEQQARMLEAADATAGYECFGGPGVNASLKAAWVPGVGAVQYPAGTGIAFEGSMMVMQVHYNTSAGQLADQTSMEFQTSATVTDEALMELFDDGELNLQPRMANAHHTWRIRPSDFGLGAVDIYGFAAHMHTLGRTQRLDVIGDNGVARCLNDVPRFDFDWQRLYFYDRPLRVSATETLRLDCGYDTRSRNENITWGEGTRDEMCMQAVYFVPR